MDLKKRLGILRSIAMYYWKPFNRRRLRKFYAQFVQKGDLCFDIGAHLGNRSDAWLQLGARVVALEPQPSCIHFLTKKFDKNNQFILVEKAVGQSSGTATLHISSLTPTVTTLAKKDWRNMIDNETSYKVKWDKSVEVPVVTMDALINEYGIPAFCKIDVENLELEVLLGLSKAIPALSIEFFSKTMSRTIACIDHLETLALYEYNWSFGESQKMDAIVWVDSNKAKSNLLSFDDERIPSGDLYARKLKK